MILKIIIFTINILLIFSLQSCSTTSVDSNSIPLSSKTLTYSSIGCIVIGLLSGLLARKYSPNKESEGANLALFGVSGCVIGGAATGSAQENTIKFNYKVLIENVKGSVISLSDESILFARTY